MEFSIVTISMFVTVLNEATKMVGETLGKNINRYIPIFSLVFGVILGIAGYYIPEVTIGSNIVEAIFIGLSAGAASTGCHQIYKQFEKASDDESEPEPATDDNEDE